MLPFLQPKKASSVIMARHKAEGGTIVDEGHEGEPNHALLAAAEDIISAVHAKDATRLAECLKHSFDILDSASDDDEQEPSVDEGSEY